MTSGAKVSLWRSKWLGLGLSLLLLLGAPLTLAPQMGGGAELVRLRNALLLHNDLEPNFDWAPPQVPAGFLKEDGPIDPVFLALVARLGLEKITDDWERARAIAGHLLERNPTVDGALKADLRSTYLGIIELRGGYCADFVRVFTAIALAANLEVRYWAFSFDGFGGHGHVFPEIWNRQRGQWQLLDVFDNYYFVDGGETPLSALQFRQALLSRSTGLQLRPLHSGARPGYAIEAKAWDYFRRGAAEWYLWWGNNVFSYDRAVLVRVFSPLSRALEQFGGIAQGVHPHIRVLPDAANLPQRQSIRKLRAHLQVVGVAMFLGFAGLLAVALKARRSRRRVASAG